MFRIRRAGVATAVVGVVLTGVMLVAAAVVPAAGASPTPRAGTAGESAKIVAVVKQAMADDHLKAVIVRVTVDGKPVITRAFGSSMTGVPATTKMHFRNGAVAISYVTTLLMKYVDQRKVTLDDPVSKWFPSLPEASSVTLKMLANMTSGYPDYVTDPAFDTAQLADPFRNFTPQEQLAYGFSRPISFPPGTNWGYAHTNIVILGQILEKVGGKPLAVLLKTQVLVPLGLKNTMASQTATIPDPVLHAFDSERRTALNLPATTPFYEDSSFWNPSWTLATGSVETSDIVDLTRTAEGIGGGKLLSKSSYAAQTGPNLLGFGSALPGCSCGTQTNHYNYGLGIVRSGSWLLQNPLFSGYAATEAYLPGQKIAVAVAVTFAPGAFAADGSYNNSSDDLFRSIGAVMAPGNPPPTK